MEIVHEQKFTEAAKAAIGENYNVYWIFFTDKGDHNELEKIEIKAKILSSLHPNAIKRRLKTEGKTLENIIDEIDFPVAEKYINRIINFSEDIKLREKTKWHNGISVEIQNNAKEILENISKYSFVKKIDIVREFNKKPKIVEKQIVENNEKKSQPSLQERSIGDIDYGSTYDQLAMINVPALHSEGLTGEGVRILILDSGSFLRQVLGSYFDARLTIERKRIQFKSSVLRRTAH